MQGKEIKGVTAIGPLLNGKIVKRLLWPQWPGYVESRVKYAIWNMIRNSDMLIMKILKAVLNHQLI